MDHYQGPDAAALAQSRLRTLALTSSNSLSSQNEAHSTATRNGDAATLL